MNDFPLEIPLEIVNKALLVSESTCCICRIRGKEIKIHVLEKEASTISQENIAILCDSCYCRMVVHSDSRELDIISIQISNLEWRKYVTNKNLNAFETASLNSVLPSLNDVQRFKEHKGRSPLYRYTINNNLLNQYIPEIIRLHKEHIHKLHESAYDIEADAENKSNMVSFYQQVLVELISFYPNHNVYNNEAPLEYFSNYISERFSWHRKLLQPYGEGVGTYISPLVLNSVLQELGNNIGSAIKILTDNDALVEEWHNVFE